MALIFLAQAVFLAFAGWNNLHMLNTDAVAYVRLAEYYASGQTQLMVSGYWGPLLSWLMAPLIAAGLPGLLAARVVMGLTALLFSWGAFEVLRRLALPQVAVLGGFALCAASSVTWSVEYISPDLLMGGLVCLALSRMLSPEWMSSPRAAISAGVLWALAYYGKAVALPMGLLASLLLATLWARTRRLPIPDTRPLTSSPQASPRPARTCALTVGVLLLAAAPWMAVLSVKYATFTFSTSARIAHAVVGPRDVDRYHPTMRTLHQPESGRLTSWEDPSRLGYAYWSPFASAEALQHQLGLVARNGVTIGRLLAGFDLLHLGAWAALAAVVVTVYHLCARRSASPGGRHSVPGSGALPGSAREPPRWCWAGPVVLGLAGVYLPVYVGLMDERYLYVVYPLLFGALAGVLSWLAERLARYRATVLRLGWTVGIVSLAAPVLLNLSLSLPGLPDSASLCAQDLAARLRQADRHGPVAGSGLLSGGRAGLYTAFLLHEPWYGDKLNAAPTDFFEAGAQLVVVGRGQELAVELDHDTRFRDLDRVLFSAGEDPSRFPLKVYERQR